MDISNIKGVYRVMGPTITPNSNCDCKIRGEPSNLPVCTTHIGGVLSWLLLRSILYERS